MIEQDTRYIIDSNLSNKGWILDINNPKKNVFFETDINRILDNPKLRKSKLKPDYVLVDSNSKPIGVIEAKAGGKNLDIALEQATEYANILQAPLIFAMNNSYCKTKHLYTNKPLFINNSEVNELIKQTEASKFLQDNTNAIYTVPKKVILSRQDLIRIFGEINKTLRGAGIKSGDDRLTEFANILFLKLFTENTDTGIWDSIKVQHKDLMIDNINAILKKIEKDHSLDNAIFKNITIKNTDILKDIIDQLDKLTLSTIDTDIKGDAFEYFIQKTPSADKDLGEYFTPRHIVKILVNLIKPKFKEKVYDPFCGTGGFLTESFNYIKNNNIITTQEDKDFLNKNTIFGGELTNNSRLAKMNMILHGDGHSGIKEIDSLANPVDNLYDIVITNIPFSQTTKFSHLYENGLAKNNGDGVCILHCLRSLKKGGRMIVIVPETFLSSADIKDVRKKIIDNAKLELVISLPAGVFEPYTNIKTSILYFSNYQNYNYSNENNKVWFYEAHSDGFSLNKKRKPSSHNDLSRIAYLDLSKNIEVEVLESLGLYHIPIKKIQDNQYVLVGNKYESYDSSYLFNSCYEKISFSDILLNPFNEAIRLESSAEYLVAGVKNYGQGVTLNKKKGSELITKSTKAYKKIKEDCLMWCSVDTKRGSFTITKKEHTDCVASNNRTLYQINTKIVIPDFLQIIFQNKDFASFLDNFVSGSTNRQYVKFNELAKIIIALPSIEEQKSIVEKIEEFSEKIEKCSEKIEVLKSQLYKKKLEIVTDKKI